MCARSSSVDGELQATHTAAVPEWQFAAADVWCTLTLIELMNERLWLNAKSHPS